MDPHEVIIFESMMMYFSHFVDNPVTRFIAAEMATAGGMMSIQMGIKNPSAIEAANLKLAEIRQKLGIKDEPAAVVLPQPSQAIGKDPQRFAGPAINRGSQRHTAPKAQATVLPTKPAMRDNTPRPPQLKRGERFGEKKHHHPRPPANDLMASKLRDAGVAPKKEEPKKEEDKPSV
jgi:hypothetical protein